MNAENIGEAFDGWNTALSMVVIMREERPAKSPRPNTGLLFDNLLIQRRPEGYRR